MNFLPTAIPDVILIEPTVFRDERGYFLEAWQERDLRAAGLTAGFVQDNHSMSVQNVLRGLHYQRRRPQGKLVRVVTGNVYDVAVDLRRSSPTFGQWVGQHLSGANHRMLWIPPGFAHGFYTLAGPAHFLYKCTEYYASGDEQCIRWDDPALGIQWPIPSGTHPLVGPKDMAGILLDQAELFL